MKIKIFTFVFLLISISTFSQNRDPDFQKQLDSLFAVWEDVNQKDTIRLKAFKKYIWDGYLFTQPDSAVYFAQLQYDFAQEKDLKEYLADALNTQGVSYGIRGISTKALEYFQKSLPIREEIGNKKSIANTQNNIGMIYRNLGDNPKALEYFQKSLAIIDEMSNKKVFGNTLNNIGLIYEEQSNYSKALDYFQRSLKINEELGSKQGIAILLNNVGSIYRKQGNDTKALEYAKKSLEFRQELEDSQGVANSLYHFGVIYKDLQGNYPKAIEFCQKGLEKAQSIEALNEQLNTCQCLYEAYKAMGNTNKALEYYEQAVVLKDSLYNEDNTKKITQLEMQYDFDKKEAATQAEQEKKDAVAAQELKQQKTLRNGFIGGFAVVLFFAGVFFTQRNRIGKEKKRSEELLLNILPAEVAEELKQKGEAEAKNYDMVSILFTDFKSFTEQSEKLTAAALVKEINNCFKTFDVICEKYNIEKIKTIGDAYMAAGGLPIPEDLSVKNTVLAALEMQNFIVKQHQEKELKGEHAFQMRVGIHTGPVVAGIVGIKKFQYDIWGDTVNTASRIESNGEVSKVNISEITYNYLKDDSDFVFESRGKVQAKGKGEIEMYFVSLRS